MLYLLSSAQERRRVLDVRATVASVESGNVEAGFVYKMDAAVSGYGFVIPE